MAFKEDFRDGKWPFGWKGQPHRVPVPRGAACVKISEILASADEYAGEYSFGGRADALPAAPGLLVEGVGAISLPLVEAQAQKLIAICEKSPFGHNMDTKLDESVRKSWQLAPDQVEITNPQWQSGLEKLSETIANRLGYMGVPLQCVLYKLLVYGEGGHFLKHQDTEKEDGMVATLVVQPPSTHEGGDLIVFRHGEVEHRHDFGRSDGTAPFFCHYAVHYADAEHALEEVTKGFRLALVYSICLATSMRHLQRGSERTLGDDLAEAIGAMRPKHDSFALLLSHEYTKKSIADLGGGALKGVDSARFRALEAANSTVDNDGMKLRFFIAKLSFKVDNRLEEDGWSKGGWGHEQALHWYTTSGEDLGHWKDKSLSEQLNFLNPGQETLMQLWKAYGSPEDVYTGNEGQLKRTKYSRFAVVAWPASHHVKNVLECISAELAVEELIARRPVDARTLRSFLNAASGRYGWRPSLYRSSGVSARFTQSFCELLADANDVDLAKQFFSDCCPSLGNLTDDEPIVASIAQVINAFAWSELSAAVQKVFNDDKYSRSPRLDLLLQVAHAVDEVEAQRDLFKLATKFEMNVQVDDRKNLEKDASELGPFVEVFSDHVGEYDTEDKFAVLDAIAAKRVEWLKREIEKLDRVGEIFTWEMPYAKHWERHFIENFLRGPKKEVTTKTRMKFRDIRHAKETAAEYSHPRDEVSTAAGYSQLQDEASFNVAIGEQKGKLFLTITKTCEWFDGVPKRLDQCREELVHLNERYDGVAGGSSAQDGASKP